MSIIVPYLNESGSEAPLAASSGSSGVDIRAVLEDAVTLAAGQRRLIPTGIRLEIPEGYEAQVRPRSGLALQHGITVLNSPGTIDSDYRGELKVILINLGESPFTVSDGDRVAQLVVAKVEQVQFVLGEKLADSSRGEGGFGSTGV